MRTDYLNELMNDVRDMNKDTRDYTSKVSERLKHITTVRDMLNVEIERLTKMEHALNQLSAENGAESFKPRQLHSGSGGVSSAMKAVDNHADNGEKLKTGT